jgi:hypothetical protein
VFNKRGSQNVSSSSSIERYQYHIPVLEELKYCLGVLKINKEDNDYKINRKIDELFASNVTIDTLNAHSKRIVALKIIAELCGSSGIGHNIFSQSELYDFLTLAAQAVVVKEQKNIRAKTATTNEIVFKIYRDIMENYQNLNDSLKLNYPRIIVDVIAVLNVGKDSNGNRIIGVSAINEYYQSRKLKATSSGLEEQGAAVATIKQQIDLITTATAARTVKAEGQKIETDRIQQSLIETLMRITGKDSNQLKESLTKLHNSDIKKISDLCSNYNKIEKYCMMANSKEFRNELETDLGKKLTDNQVYRAALSIRKLRKYIEDLLDGKFVPHNTHGINHTKHNLEYGYQVMGLIERNRRCASSK